MGIPGLQKFMQSSPLIAQQCDFKKEIEQWRHDHNGANPTILIDMKEFMNIIPRIFSYTLSSGGEFDKYIEAVTYFLEELTRCRVDLVFFVKEKHFTDLEKTKMMMTDETLSVLNGSAVKVERGSKRLAYNLTLIAQKYGRIHVLVDRHTIVIVNYAAQNEDKVLSIIANDTDFLVFDGKYQYWSMGQWMIRHCYPSMEAIRYDRGALMSDIRLSNEQIRLLVTLSDALKDWKYFDGLPSQSSLKRAMDYVREQHLTDTNTFDWEKIASRLYGTNYAPEQIAELIKRYEDFGKIRDRQIGHDFYDRLSPETVEVWKFCEANHFFMFRTIIGSGERVYWLKDLCCLKDDCHRIEFTDAILTVLAKFSGILHNDESEEHRPETKLFFNSFLADNNGDFEYREIIYPTDLNLTLKQLIMDENNRVYDDQRWSLLQWMLGTTDGFMTTVRNIPQSKKIRVAMIALQFMLARNFISPASAKCILRNELIGKKSTNAYIPRTYCPPPKVVKRRRISDAMSSCRHEAHKYTITYLMVCQALEVCGLRKETDLITFNAYHFYDEVTKPTKYSRKTEFEEILFPVEAE